MLLAQEGINGTIAGAPDAIDAFAHELAHGALFGGRLNNLELKCSTAEAMPFGRLKVRLKKEIVTLGDADRRSDPAGRHLCRGRRLERADRGARHAGARHPQRLRGGDGHVRGRGRSQTSRALASSRISPPRSSIRQSIGGSRCSAPAASAARRRARICSRAALPRSITSRAASSKYLEEVPEAQSRWRGECFVFDERVALGHGLRERGLREQDKGHGT